MAEQITRRITNVDVDVLARSSLVRAFMLRTLDDIADPLTGHVFAVSLAKKAAEAFDLFYDDGVTFARALLGVAAHVIALESAIRHVASPSFCCREERRLPATPLFAAGGKMNFGTVQSSFAAAAKQTGLLGTLFWWDLGNNRIDHKLLVERADQARLDKSLLPSAVKPATAFKRAWRAAARRMSDDLLLREISDTPDQLVVAVVREHADVLNLHLRYEVLARATFNKKTESIALLEKHDILDGLGALFAHYSAITTEDVRAMVLGFVRRSGLSIRSAGGVYFIPPALSDTLRALTEVLHTVGTNTTWALPVANLGHAAATLGSLARETLDAEIAGVEAQLAAFDASEVETRDSTLQRRLKKFDEIRARTNLMAGALSFRADALHEKLAALENDVKRRLVGDAPALAPRQTSIDDRAVETAGAFDAEVGF